MKSCDKTMIFFTFLVLIIQLLNRNSETRKNFGRKIESLERNFRDGTKFNKFDGV